MQIDHAGIISCRNIPMREVSGLPDKNIDLPSRYEKSSLISIIEYRIACTGKMIGHAVFRYRYVFHARRRTGCLGKIQRLTRPENILPPCFHFFDIILSVHSPGSGLLLIIPNIFYLSKLMIFTKLCFFCFGD